MKSTSAKLMLGTVQLGMPYGIANRSGQPSRQRAVEIVAAALEGGITSFDTAACYGESERILGGALRELGVLEEVLVVTKVAHLADAVRADPVAAARAIELSVDRSRQRLGLDCLPMVLFHSEADAVHVDVLEQLRQRGWLRRVGVSLASAPTAPVRLDPRFTAVQTPANLLDQWPRQQHVVASISQPGRAVFARSVYLQGLLVMPADMIPPHLAEILPFRRKLAELAADYGISEPELALRYTLSLSAVTRTIIGVETLGQLRDNLRMASKGSLAADLLARIDDAAAGVPTYLLTPSVWPELVSSTKIRTEKDSKPR